MAVSSSFAGISVWEFLLAVILVAFFVWDALRFPADLWSRWLLPIGAIPFLFGTFRSEFWVVAAGLSLMALGFYLTKSWKQRNMRKDWFG
ncbi:hypothetical protein [Streptomyces sp. NPDC008125]|uniref:hypothetical protein n=1 Tax=Streptomyces sp. NPDC008125 TaxID=3364811 RepID=UPI0036E79EC6